MRFVNEGGTNQEGLYWRYEMAIRRLESRLRSVTAGNGAIYATRRESYIEVDAVMGHDLSFPFNMVKRGWRAVYAPQARATEAMVPSLEGEFARKRRFMGHTWPIMLRGGILSPRGYDPLYAVMIFSHRVLRYLTPFLHVIALGASLALIGDGPVYDLAVVAPAGRAGRRRAGAADPEPPAADRPLLRADHRRRRRPACGTSWCTARPPAGIRCRRSGERVRPDRARAGPRDRRARARSSACR